MCSSESTTLSLILATIALALLSPNKETYFNYLNNIEAHFSPMIEKI